MGKKKVVQMVHKKVHLPPPAGEQSGQQKTFGEDIWDDAPPQVEGKGKGRPRLPKTVGFKKKNDELVVFDSFEDDVIAKKAAAESLAQFQKDADACCGSSSSMGYIGDEPHWPQNESMDHEAAVNLQAELDREEVKDMTEREMLICINRKLNTILDEKQELKEMLKKLTDFFL